MLLNVLRFSFIAPWIGVLLLGLVCCGESSEPANNKEPSPLPLADLPVDVMTFNIRYGVAGDGMNSWVYRKEMVAEVIASRDPDIIGMQEAWLFQLIELEEILPQYSYVARTREVDENIGEATPIVFHNERWTLDESDYGTLWLSDTPTVPASTSWGNTLPRIVTWVRLIHRATGRPLYVFNTHLDHESENARVKGAEFIVQEIAQRAQSGPVVVLGDFNAGEGSTPLEVLLNGPESLVDSFRVHRPDEELVGTIHGFTGDKYGAKIDYVLVQPIAEVLDASIIHDEVEGSYPSDHFPVEASLLFPGGTE